MMKADATTIAIIVGIETGEIIKIGDRPGDWYPKVATAMVKMHAELSEFRKLDKIWPDSTKFPD